MRPLLFNTFLAATFLSGCGSDDIAPVTAATVPLSDYGVIRVHHDTATAQTQLDAVFCDLATATTAATIDRQFLTDVDRCTVSNEGTTASDITAPLVCSTNLPAQTISAGSNLTVTSGIGTYADLTQQQTDGTITYTVNNPLPRPPGGLTLDIPGDTFPQFSAVSIPDLQDLVINLPATGEALRSDSRITWGAATNGTNSRLLLTATDADVTVDCSLADDGSFTFSTATQAELGELFAAGTISIRRQNFISPTRGDSGLVIVTSIQ